MDRLFQNFLAEPFGFGESATGWGPDVEIRETDREVEVRAEIPGMDPADIQLSVQGTTLTISGEKREEREEEKRDLYVSEIRYGSFQRSVELPEGADPDRVTADYDKGVLRVKIAKNEAAAPKRIAVKGTSRGEKTDGEGKPSSA
jgi:HSP20 family protein